MKRLVGLRSAPARSPRSVRADRIRRRSCASRCQNDGKNAGRIIGDHWGNAVRTFSTLRRHVRRAAGITLAIGLGAAAAQAQVPAPSAGPTVQIAYGPVQGMQKSGVAQFLGIPY